MSEDKLGKNIDKAASTAYKAGRVLRDIKAIQQSAKKKSLSPIVKRLIRKLLGRKIASKIFKLIK